MEKLYTNLTNFDKDQLKHLVDLYIKITFTGYGRECTYFIIQLSEKYNFSIIERDYDADYFSQLYNQTLYFDEKMLMAKNIADSGFYKLITLNSDNNGRMKMMFMVLIQLIMEKQYYIEISS